MKARLSGKGSLTAVAHAPAGNFARPEPEQGIVCWCGAALVRVSNEASDPRHLDWKVIDEEGRTYVDWTPTFRYRKPDGEIIAIDMHDADAWDRLAQVDIGKYSVLKATLDLGGSFYHPHREETKPEDLGLSVEELRARSKNPPECHGKPMWAAPDGWRCREAYGEPALMPYAEEGDPAA